MSFYYSSSEHIPIEKVKNLVKNFENNKLSLWLVAMTCQEYIYLFPVKEPLKQKLKSTLGYNRRQIKYKNKY